MTNREMELAFQKTPILSNKWGEDEIWKSRVTMRRKLRQQDIGWGHCHMGGRAQEGAVSAEDTGELLQLLL